MFNDKFNKPYVDFLNINYPQEDHLILCRRVHHFDFPKGSNVVEVKDYSKVNMENFNGKLICHSLFDKKVVDLLNNNKNLLEKAYWVVWGGDLYGAPDDEKNNFIRRNLKGYLTVAPNDQKIIANKYGNYKAKYFNIQYIIPTSFEQLHTAKQNKVFSDKTRILINNSCSESTIEMLDILAKFAHENIEVSTILSYGDLKFKEAIISQGRAIYRDKFSYLDEMLSPGEYANYLNNISIFIFNQNRQQGLGNIFAALYLGAKIYIKNNISSSEMLKNLEFKIYDTYDIENINFYTLIKNNNTEFNSKKALLFFDVNHIKSLWGNVFKDET